MTKTGLSTWHTLCTDACSSTTTSLCPHSSKHDVVMLPNSFPKRRHCANVTESLLGQVLMHVFQYDGYEGLIGCFFDGKLSQLFAICSDPAVD